MQLLFRFRPLLLGVSLLLLTLGLSHQAQAMTVSPVRLELSGNPGETIKSSFKVTNEEKQSKTLYTVFENFEALGESGTPNFVPGEEGLARWLRAADQITVAPGETKTVDFSVEIPAEAEPGGYFAAIFLSSSPPDAGGSEVTIGSRIGSLLLFRVNGDMKEEGSLLEFATKDSRKVYSALPINFYYRFNNQGADRILPKGSLVIKNTLGFSTATSDANPTQGNVLPDSIRRFEIWWQADDKNEAVPHLAPTDLSFGKALKYQWHNFAFGKYTGHLQLHYGSSDQTAEATFTIFVFPWQLLLVELGVLLVVGGGLWFGIKHYNSWIVKRSRS